MTLPSDAYQKTTARAEWTGDDPFILGSDGSVLYEPCALEGLSERCINRLAEICEDGELSWEECADILSDEGYHNIY